MRLQRRRALRQINGSELCPWQINFAWLWLSAETQPRYAGERFKAIFLRSESIKWSEFLMLSLASHCEAEKEENETFRWWYGWRGLDDFTLRQSLHPSPYLPMKWQLFDCLFALLSNFPPQGRREGKEARSAFITQVNLFSRLFCPRSEKSGKKHEAPRGGDGGTRKKAIPHHFILTASVEKKKPESQ